VVEDIGPAPEGVRYLHICDRGADDFEFFCRLHQARDGWVVRVAKGHRKVEAVQADAPHAKRLALQQLYSQLPVLHRQELEVPAKPGQAARTATVELRATRVLIPRPRQCSPWVKRNGESAIAMSAVEVREINPPQGAEPVHWMLLSSEPCGTLAEVQRIVTDYEHRWVIEDYHKGVKTGCAMEDRQYMTAARLERVLGVMSVAAIRLLQLRAAARKTPDEPARNHVPVTYLIVLCAVLKCRAATRIAKRTAQRQLPTADTITNREFYRLTAQLGGFLARKHDGEPGWQTLWRGFEKLQLMVRTHDAINSSCG
jgi:hypothetical protein